LNLQLPTQYEKITTQRFLNFTSPKATGGGFLIFEWTIFLSGINK
jgi:hypothetical protein